MSNSTENSSCSRTDHVTANYVLKYIWCQVHVRDGSMPASTPELISRIEESRALNDVERLKALFPTALTPLFEAIDLVTIHRGLRHVAI